MTPLETILKSHLPRCLAAVRASAATPVDHQYFSGTAFALSNKLNDDADARILGFPLSAYNPACKDDPDFISPLSLQWTDDSEACVFDSDVHGYHGEMDSSAKYRGSGAPNVFVCGNCGPDRFRVVVHFDYSDACDDLLEGEPDLPAQDYFSGIRFFGTCTKCGNVTTVLSMDL